MKTWPVVFWCLVGTVLCLIGSEVAQYAATHFPKFLKTVFEYTEGSLATALENAFLGFDATLVTEDVKTQLKTLAASGEKTREEDAEDEESMLRVYIVCIMHRFKGLVTMNCSFCQGGNVFAIVGLFVCEQHYARRTALCESFQDIIVIIYHLFIGIWRPKAGLANTQWRTITLGNCRPINSKIWG